MSQLKIASKSLGKIDWIRIVLGKTMKKAKESQIGTWALGNQEIIKELVSELSKYVSSPFVVALSTPSQGEQSISLKVTEKINEQKKFLENLRKKFVRVEQQPPAIESEKNAQTDPAESKRVEEPVQSMFATQEEYITHAKLADEEVKFIEKVLRISIARLDVDKGDQCRALSESDEGESVLVLIQSLFGDSQPDLTNVVILVDFDIGRGFEDEKVAPRTTASCILPRDERAGFVCKKHGGICTHFCRNCQRGVCAKEIAPRPGRQESCKGHEVIDLISYQAEMEKTMQGCINQVNLFSEECQGAIECMKKDYHEILQKKENNEKRQKILLAVSQKMQNIQKMDQTQPVTIENEDKRLTRLLNSCYVPQLNSENSANNSQFFPANDSQFIQPNDSQFIQPNDSQFNQAENEEYETPFYVKLARMMRAEAEFNKSFAENKEYEQNPRNLWLNEKKNLVTKLEEEATKIKAQAQELNEILEKEAKAKEEIQRLTNELIAEREKTEKLEREVKELKEKPAAPAPTG